MFLGGTARPVCFEKLLVGGTFDSFNHEELNMGKEPLIALFRARVLSAHGIAPDVPPTRHTILLIKKKGRRIIANFKKVFIYIIYRYVDMYTRVLSAHGIAPDVPPTRHTILLIQKKGRRIIANFKKVFISYI